MAIPAYPSLGQPSSQDPTVKTNWLVNAFKQIENWHRVVERTGPKTISVKVLEADAVSLVSGAAKTVASTELYAGTWDISFVAGWLPAATTNITELSSSLSFADNTEDTTIGQYVRQGYPGGVVFGAVSQNQTLPAFQVTLSAPAPVYLVLKGTFSVSTLKGFGYLVCREASG